jgi:hypothetical protein
MPNTWLLKVQCMANVVAGVAQYCAVVPELGAPVVSPEFL